MIYDTARDSTLLVDTSAWIEFLNGRFQPSPEMMLKFFTCPPIIQEVIQGLKKSKESELFKNHLLALPCLSESVSLNLYIKAAEIFNLGRRRGFTIRSSIDCLIAQIAIESAIPVLHKDRDYELIGKFTQLETVSLDRFIGEHSK